MFRPLIKHVMLLACLWPVALGVQAVELKPDHPREYTVQEDDTLWGIAQKFLDNPWLWPEIWQVNEQIENPHRIYPGDVIGLVYKNKQVKVTVVERDPEAIKAVVRLSPTARISHIDTAIPAIPMDAISSFMTNSRIVKSEDLSGAPYVIAGDDRRILAGGGGNVYARGFEQEEPQTGYGIFRKGELYVDPDTSEVLGLEAREIGAGTVERWDGDIARLRLGSTREEVMIGDRLLSTDERKLVSTFVPSSPEQEIQGRMIAVLSGVNQIGQYHVVVTNQGSRDGVKEGNVLAIYKDGDVVLDRVANRKVQLPAERSGLLMLFRVFDKVSYGLVLRANRPLSIGDQIRNP